LLQRVIEVVSWCCLAGCCLKEKTGYFRMFHKHTDCKYAESAHHWNHLMHLDMCFVHTEPCLLLSHNNEMEFKPMLKILCQYLIMYCTGVQVNMGSGSLVQCLVKNYKNDHLLVLNYKPFLFKYYLLIIARNMNYSHKFCLCVHHKLFT